MNILWVIGLGSGLAGAAAFRAIFPLILASFTRVVNFPPALKWLQSTPVLLFLLILMVVEFLIDELPGVSFLHSIIYIAIKVLVGGILFSAAVGINPFIGIILGGLITGFLIFSRLALEPWIQREQPYFRHLEYQTIENLASIVLTIIAIAVPWFSLLVIAGLIYSTIKVAQQVA
ncbi:hypothetical protein BBF96_09660 [Anoxybacter fermentans]|uniref:DUF4126 domain-containing protein n=1 Tax=Anoxybacter fermentans TaxID=1323375 RepID=A0A3S9SZB1_9FIRM|nr:DUF4126 domain-containing protein [Anoxybacter fermentans]AZR73629.1 hypothetical protein BBF96_09660 [Anoxybacter fermentans]